MPGENTEQRKLAAIMFTDMVGYSALTQRNEALALDLLREHHEILRQILPVFQGSEIKSTGDGLLIEFSSALAAVQCAVEIQGKLAGRNQQNSQERQIQIRIGIHLGDVVRRDQDVLGDGVNIAARIEPLAEPGGICVTRAVFEQIENKVPLQMVQLNRPELKNISARVEVFKLLLDGRSTDTAAPDATASSKPFPARGKFQVGLVVGVITLLVIGVVLVFTLSRKKVDRGNAGQITIATAFCPVVGDEVVTGMLKPIRQKFDLPAMAAAVLTSDGIKYVGAVGVRKRGTQVPVALDDLWHLGSDGKAMTSTLIARLVGRGQLRWDSTLAEVFPDLAPQMNPDFQKVTLLQLLSHRAGLPANLDIKEYLGTDVESLRLRAVRDVLAQKPQSPPGSQIGYSNLGYIIAGAVVEKVTGGSWENAIASEVFKPLRMKSAGFGGTGTPGQIDQPWPHTGDGSPTAENGPGMDNPPVMGPAGRVHCSIQDWARFAQDQLRGARGESALLKLESYQKMHTPPFGGDYALGWKVVQRPWAGGTALNHGGDNTMNFANIWIAPQRDFAILVCVNQSGGAAAKAADAAIVAMIDLLKKQDQSK